MIIKRECKYIAWTEGEMLLPGRTLAWADNRKPTGSWRIFRGVGRDKGVSHAKAARRGRVWKVRKQIGLARVQVGEAQAAYKYAAQPTRETFAEWHARF